MAAQVVVLQEKVEPVHRILPQIEGVIAAGGGEAIVDHDERIRVLEYGTEQATEER